jgi:hypothetical protein
MGRQWRAQGQDVLEVEELAGLELEMLELEMLELEMLELEMLELEMLEVDHPKEPEEQKVVQRRQHQSRTKMPEGLVEVHTWPSKSRGHLLRCAANPARSGRKHSSKEPTFQAPETRGFPPAC